MTYQTILFERIGRVAKITINRPEAMNAINVQAWNDLGNAFERFVADEDLWAAVLTGAGDRCFCAGADLKEVASGVLLQQTEQMQRWGFAGLVKQYADKPVIAAVNGHALGGGTELALFSDIVIASRTANFGLPEVKRGLVAAAGGLLRLPRQIPLKVAMQHILTGDPMSAEKALRWGLINEVVEPGEVVATALALAQRICENSPIAVRASKDIIHRSLMSDLEADGDAWRISAEGAARNRASADAIEGPRAFAEKRAPVWTGR
ncbi:crotonase/enoyl-CoA hydratase family protein [Ottowia thiooxydans]|uniref:crotonase/enoyl-CoA hydratase family protein n=1 Tax=Ottowia thiooxydans TaxID=219182 RepID=UPI0003FEA823|nr:crotonase/enoyl-CoA hydratase family protein [Ottowia thiooxydans]